MLKITHTKYSVEKLLNTYHNGNLIIANENQDSSIVEAILLGIPITRVCQQCLGGKLKAVSNNIKSLVDFCSNKKPFKSYGFYPQFEGKFFTELDNLYVNILMNFNITVVRVMHNDKSEDIKNLVSVMEKI